MANEIEVRSVLRIVKDPVDYESRPDLFQADIIANIAAGPSPGMVVVAKAGTNISLSELSTPGLCRIQNQGDELDSTTYASVGIWDGATFYPFMELLNGESYVIRFSRSLLTSGNLLRANCNQNTVKLNVEAFEQ